MVEHYERSFQKYHEMPLETQAAFINQLKLDYRQILLTYFNATDPNLKYRSEHFIHKLFEYDITVPQIIEIHMEIIDDFSKQLRLEGRKDEIVMDYRLTLIEILAQLCEMYRAHTRK